jgi:uncharacterized protein
MRLALVLTHRCDLACGYCSSGPKSSRDMPFERGRRAIDLALAALAPGRTLFLVLYGGEPLLVWPLARALLAHARLAAARRGVLLRPLVTSNGTRLSDELLDELLALEVELTLSLDGLPADHDALRRSASGRGSSAAALRALERLAARGGPVRVQSVVRPETAPRLGQAARFLADRGATCLAHDLDWSAPWRAAHLPGLRAGLRELAGVWAERRPALEVAWLDARVRALAGVPLPPCGSAPEVAVAPSGRLYACERLVGEDLPGSPLARGHLDRGLAAPPLACAPAPAACAPCGAQATCLRACACTTLARAWQAGLPDGLLCALEGALQDELARALRGPARPLPLAAEATHAA